MATDADMQKHVDAVAWMLWGRVSGSGLQIMCPPAVISFENTGTAVRRQGRMRFLKYWV